MMPRLCFEWIGFFLHFFAFSYLYEQTSRLDRHNFSVELWNSKTWIIINIVVDASILILLFWIDFKDDRKIINANFKHRMWIFVWMLSIWIHQTQLQINTEWIWREILCSIELTFELKCRPDNMLFECQTPPEQFTSSRFNINILLPSNEIYFQYYLIEKHISIKVVCKDEWKKKKSQPHISTSMINI